MNETMDHGLFGRWHVVHHPTDQSFTDVTLEFLDDRSLTYIIHRVDKDQVILLRFRTDGGVIITDQDSDPREERTPYEFSGDGQLMLLHDGKLTSYSREE